MSEQETKTDHSTMKMISVEEEKLRIVLEETEKKTEATITDTEKEAAGRLDKFREEIVQIISDKRKKELIRLKEQVQKEQEAFEKEITAMNENTLRNISVAADKILAKVFPGEVP